MRGRFEHGSKLPQLIVGDFNTPTVSDIYDVAWHGFANAFEQTGWGFGYTAPCTTHRRWFNDVPWVRIDHILADDHWTVYACGIGSGNGSDHRLIWAKLDQAHAKHPDMVLLHGGSPKGAELIAAKWADNRKVPQIAFKPDWTKHAKAAPFKRNDVMLDVLPIGVMHFPGTGIQDNLADKAKKLGIPVWKFGTSGA